MADVKSEDAHGYDGRAFFTVASVLDDSSTAVASSPAGERESFVARASSTSAFIVVRSDRAIDARVEIGNSSII